MTGTPPTDNTAELYLLLGRIDGKVDGIVTALAAMNSRTETLEKRVDSVEGAGVDNRQEIEKIKTERSVQVPEFDRLKSRASDLENWRTKIEERTSTTALIIRIIWGLVGTAVIAMMGWGLKAYVHSLDAPNAERHETTEIRSTITTPATAIPAQPH